MVDTSLLFLRICLLLIGVLIIVPGAFLILSLRDIDENNMDSYDRFYGISDDGRTRGVFGTIYDSEGNVDTWATFTDHNPHWSKG